MGLLDMYPFINIRRNHGLEHATIHILSRRVPHLSMVGRSDVNGFTLYGTIDTEEVKRAAHEALNRLRHGQEDLAVHPRCGTILATTGVLTGLATFAAIGLSGRPRKRFRWGTLPEAIMAATFAALMAQPLGMFVQEKFTVSGNPGPLEITGIQLTGNPGMVIHRISTSQQE